jgi:phosphatidylinositol alpha-1,6-mannosyltransferase
LTTFYPPAKGGIQTYTNEIAKNLKKLGNDVTVFAITSNGIKKLFSSSLFKIYKNEIKSINISLLFSKFDVILVSSWFPSAIIGVFLSFLFKSKLVISAHGNEILYPKKYPFINRLMKWCFNNAYKIFAVSNYTKKLLIKNSIDRGKIFVIPNGTNPDYFNPEVPYEDIIKKHKLENKKIIFSVSRLEERKNFGRVIETLPEVLKEIPNTVYIIGGTGSMRGIWEQIAVDNKVEDIVKFVGYIPDEELPKYYNMCDVFVMPSIEIEKKGEIEGFGITFLEANSCGKPVIGGMSGGVSDAIIDGKTGVLINPNDFKDIKKAILKLLKDEKYSKFLGTNGRKRVLKELSWLKITEKISKELIDN